MPFCAAVCSSASTAATSSSRAASTCKESSSESCRSASSHPLRVADNLGSSRVISGHLGMSHPLRVADNLGSSRVISACRTRFASRTISRSMPTTSLTNSFSRPTTSSTRSFSKVEKPPATCDEVQPRYGQDMAEIRRSREPRYGRGTAEVWPTDSRDMADGQPRCGRTVSPGDRRDAAESPRCDRARHLGLDEN